MIQHYYEARAIGDGTYEWKVYRYDPTGSREVVVARGSPHRTQGEAEDAACEWAEENDVDAELA